jgi:DNA-binding GntR family transcriptional regulator
MAGNFRNPFANRVSTHHSIATAVRDAIIEGTLLAGEPLKQEELAKHFGISSIPIREALRHLESEGWINILANKGAFVRPLSIDEAREIYEILSALECAALKLALPKHTPETLGLIEHLLNAGSKDRALGQETLHNLKFHMSLYAPAQKPTLMKMIEGLRYRSERYLRLKLSMSEEWEKSDREHRAILKACTVGQGERAVSLLEKHLLGTGERLVRYFQIESHRRRAEPSDSLAAIQREIGNR